MGATRLPNKMMLPFYENEGIFELLVSRLLSAGLQMPIIVATTNSEQDNVLATVANDRGLSVYRGSEHNVLERFINAAKQFSVDRIIRICADNPLLDISALQHQITAFNNSDVDYWCYCTSESLPSIKTSYGFYTEGVTLDALEKVAEMTTEKLYIEHVTNYIYTHDTNFTIHKEEIPKTVSTNKSIRLTIDTPKDHELIKNIYTKLIEEHIVLEQEHIVAFIEKHPKWMEAMTTEMRNNIK